MVLILSILLVAAVVLYVALKIQLVARKAKRFYHAKADGTQVIHLQAAPATQTGFYYGELFK